MFAVASQPALSVPTIVLTIISAFFVAARFVTRWQGAGIALDDYLILLTLIFTIGCMVTVLVCIHFGGGAPAWAITAIQMINVKKCVLAHEFLITLTIVNNKVAVLVMYSRLFRTGRRFRICQYALGLFVLLWGISMFVMHALQCVPLKKIWHPDFPGYCLTSLKMAYLINSVPSIMTYTAILCLPMPYVWKMKAPLSHRLKVSLLFLPGFFVLFSCAYRFYFLLNSDQSLDGSGKIKTELLWSIIQINGSVIGACIPLLRPFIFGISSAFSTHTSDSSHALTDFSGFTTSPTSGGQAAGQLQCVAGEHIDYTVTRKKSSAFYRLRRNTNMNVLHSPHGEKLENEFKVSLGGIGSASDDVPLNAIHVTTEVEWSATRVPEEEEDEPGGHRRGKSLHRF